MSLCCSNEGGGEVRAKFDYLQEAKGALKGTNYTYAIEAIGEVIDVGGPIVDVALWHDCFYVCVDVLLKV